MTKYGIGYDVFHTAQEAKEFTDQKNAEATRYMRKHHPASYRRWTSDGVHDVQYICTFYFPYE